MIVGFDLTFALIMIIGLLVPCSLSIGFIKEVKNLRHVISSHIKLTSPDLRDQPTQTLQSQQTYRVSCILEIDCWFLVVTLSNNLEKCLSACGRRRAYSDCHAGGDVAVTVADNGVFLTRLQERCLDAHTGHEHGVMEAGLGEGIDEDTASTGEIASLSVGTASCNEIDVLEDERGVDFIVELNGPVSTVTGAWMKHNKSLKDIIKSDM